MNYAGEARVAALSDVKHAALYFKYVLPLDPLEVFPESDQSLHGWQRVMRGLLPPEFLDSTEPTGLSEPVINFLSHFVMMSPDIFGISLSPEELKRRRAEHGAGFVKQGLELAAEGNFRIENIMLSSSERDTRTRRIPVTGSALRVAAVTQSDRSP